MSKLLAPLALLASLLPACDTVAARADALPADDAVRRPGLDRPAYAAMSREREAELRVELRKILDVTLPQAIAAEASLQADLEALTPPVVLAARHADLRSWHKDAVAAYQADVKRVFDEHEASMRALFDNAIAEGEAEVVARAATRSPLDPGLTGDPLLDRQMASFRETLEREFAFENLEADRQEWKLRDVTLYETYNAFGDDAALAAIGGRLILFVGGDELGNPRACLVLELDEGRPASTRGFLQAMRHRVMRGDTLVQDMGWRALPEQTPLEVYGRYVIATGIAPTLDATEPGFDALRDMRLLCDMQTAVFDEQAKVLGGVDWQLEFRITVRGDVSWQLSGGSPAFDAECAELKRLMTPAGG